MTWPRISWPTRTPRVRATESRSLIIGKGHAGVTGQVLPEAQTSGRDALVATPTRHARARTCRRRVVTDAVSIQIQLNEARACKISRQWLDCDGEDGRELRQ